MHSYTHTAGTRTLHTLCQARQAHERLSAVAPYAPNKHRMCTFVRVHVLPGGQAQLFHSREQQQQQQQQQQQAGGTG